MNKELSEFIDDFQRRLILYGVKFVKVEVLTEDDQTHITERVHTDE